MTSVEGTIISSKFCPMGYDICPNGHRINLEVHAGFPKNIERSFENFFSMVPQGTFIHLFIHRVLAPVRSLLFHVSNKYKRNIALYEGLNMNKRGSGEFVNGGWIMTAFYEFNKEIPIIGNMEHAHKLYFSRHPMESGGLDPLKISRVAPKNDHGRDLVETEKDFRELLQNNLSLVAGDTVILYGTMFPKLRHFAVKGASYENCQINLILAELVLKKGTPYKWIPTSAGLFGLESRP